MPEIELGREYMLAVGQPAPDAGHADQYLAHLQSEGLTPMLRQPRGERDFETVDAAVIGTFGAPQAWGNEIRPGRRADFRITRPVDGPLVLLVATRSMPGLVTIEAVGPGGPVREDVYLGSVVTLPLGDGRAGEPAQVSLTRGRRAGLDRGVPRRALLRGAARRRPAGAGRRAPLRGRGAAPGAGLHEQHPVVEGHRSAAQVQGPRRPPLIASFLPRRGTGEREACQKARLAHLSLWTAG